MRQAIAVLAVAAVIMASVWLVINRSSAGGYMNHGKSNAFSDGTDYQGMWRNGELEYVVFVPPMVIVDSQSSQWLGSMKPAPKGLTVIPEGLYNDGVPVATSESRKAFVILASGRLAPLNLDKNLLSYMQLRKIENLERSPAWPAVSKAIRDAVESEVETGTEQSGAADG